MTIKQLKEIVDRLAATCHPLTEVRLGILIEEEYGPDIVRNGGTVDRLEYNPQNSAINILIK